MPHFSRAYYYEPLTGDSYMPSFRETFPRGKVLLCVIHAQNRAQILRNLGIAREGGADGAFLINHQIPGRQLRFLYAEAVEENRDWWIGLNFLDHSIHDVLDILPPYAKGLWIDNAGIHEDDPDPSAEARLFDKRRKNRPLPCLYFGGVAFKYQETVDDPALAAMLACPYVDVITTSGTATGAPADLRKVQSMKEAIGDHALAIASGVTPENVRDYLPSVDAFLVSTGISRSFTELDPARVRLLAEIIHNG